MVEFAAKPEVLVSDGQVSVTLRVRDGSADLHWRTFFNERAKESGLDAEAMGSRSGDVDRTVIVVRMARDATSAATVKALDAAREVAKEADAGFDRRKTAGSQIAQGASEWWRLLGISNPNEVPQEFR
jgi:hypothetical protein